MITIKLLIFLLFSSSLFSQTITGKVTDKIDVIPFANVILKDANNKTITGTTTTDEGAFELNRSTA